MQKEHAALAKKIKKEREAADKQAAKIDKKNQKYLSG